MTHFHASTLRRTCRLLLAAVTLAVLAPLASASDHADPMDLEQLEAGITDLFAFPDGDNLVVILNVRRALTQAGSLKLEPYTYRLHLDFHSTVLFDRQPDVIRYGGTVRDPEGISPDATVTLRLKNDASLASVNYEGLKDSGKIELYTGIRDDPFIFPPFFGTNIVAMVLRIPFASLPPGRQDFILWGTSFKGSAQIDHVGRSLRTMLPRFETLNKLPPSAHVREIQRIHEHPTIVEDIKRVYLSPLFAHKVWDTQPDVMIYSRRFPVGYPNGRLLTDDVAALTAERGDTLLYEISFNNLRGWPRVTTNDKPFLKEFPYLAEPWPEKPGNVPPALMPATKTKIKVIIAALVIAFILENVLVVKLFRRRS